MRRFEMAWIYNVIMKGADILRHKYLFLREQGRTRDVLVRDDELFEPALGGVCFALE